MAWLSKAKGKHVNSPLVLIYWIGAFISASSSYSLHSLVENTGSTAPEEPSPSLSAAQSIESIAGNPMSRISVGSLNQVAVAKQFKVRRKARNDSNDTSDLSSATGVDPQKRLCVLRHYTFRTKNGIQTDFVRISDSSAEVNINLHIGVGFLNLPNDISPLMSYFVLNLVLWRLEEVASSSAGRCSIEKDVSSDYTSVRIKAQSAFVKTVFNLLSEGLKRPLFTETTLESAAARLGNDVLWNQSNKILNNCGSRVYDYTGTNPPGFFTKGYMKTFRRSCTAESVYRFINSYYQPELMKLLVIGSFQEEEVKMMLDRSVGSIEGDQKMGIPQMNELPSITGHCNKLVRQRPEWIFYRGLHVPALTINFPITKISSFEEMQVYQHLFTNLFFGSGINLANILLNENYAYKCCRKWIEYSIGKIFFYAHDWADTQGS